MTTIILHHDDRISLDILNRLWQKTKTNKWGMKNLWLVASSSFPTFVRALKPGYSSGSFAQPSNNASIIWLLIATFCLSLSLHAENSSRKTGKPRSDLELFVIKEGLARNAAPRQMVRRALFGVLHPVDAHVFMPEEFEETASEELSLTWVMPKQACLYYWSEDARHRVPSLWLQVRRKE